MSLPSVSPLACCTFTFCDVGEAHVGMEKLGKEAAVGFSLADLKAAQARLEALGCETELVDLALSAGLPGAGSAAAAGAAGGGGAAAAAVDPPAAFILLARGGLDRLLGGTEKRKSCFEALAGLPWDRLFWDRRRKQVLKKHARATNVMADVEQEPDFAKGRGTVVSFQRVEAMQLLLKEFHSWGPAFQQLKVAEGNFYDDGGLCKNGIGFHGDGERRLVLGTRFGLGEGPSAGSMDLFYQWFHQGSPVGRKVRLPVAVGDLYIMSDKAVGNDWLRKKVLTLRHATGAPKYTGEPLMFRGLKRGHPEAGEADDAKRVCV